jgi:hypothetical protein
MRTSPNEVHVAKARILGEFFAGTARHGIPLANSSRISVAYPTTRWLERCRNPPARQRRVLSV